MASFNEAATLFVAGKQGPARARIAEALRAWAPMKKRLDELRRARLRQGLPALDRAPDLKFFWGDLIQTLPLKPRLAFVKEIVKASGGKLESDPLWLLATTPFGPIVNHKPVEAAPPKPDLADALFAEAELEAASGKISEALATAAQAREAAKGPSRLRAIADLYNRLGRAETALDIVSTLADRPGSDADLWVEKAWLNLRLQREAPAERALRDAEIRKPGPGDRHRMALMYQTLKRYPKAVSLLTDLARENPRDGSVLSDKGLSEFLGGDPIAAVADFQKALAADPSYLPAYLNLGAVYEKQGRREEARAVYAGAEAVPETLQNREFKSAVALARRALAPASTK
jgi:tetratricopeptide (TPR) repeat protein